MAGEVYSPLAANPCIEVLSFISFSFVEWKKTAAVFGLAAGRPGRRPPWGAACRSPKHSRVAAVFGTAAGRPGRSPRWPRLKYFELLHPHCMAVAPAPDLTVGQVTTLYGLYLTWFLQTDRFPRGKLGYGQVHNSMISSIPAIFTFRRFPPLAIHHFTRLLITKMAGNLGRGSGIYGRTHGGTRSLQFLCRNVIERSI